MASVLEDVSPEFKFYSRRDIAQKLASVPEEQSVLLLELEQLALELDDESEAAYQTSEWPLSHDISFPTLLSQASYLKLSRDDLESELALILEMRTEDVDNTAGLYSVTVVEPQPFQSSRELEDELSAMAHAVATNARAGFLVHDELYMLRSEPIKLHDLVYAFLSGCKVVDVKVKRPDESIWRTVKVKLIG